jgi:hypothetical protein
MNVNELYEKIPDALKGNIAVGNLYVTITREKQPSLNLTKKTDEDPLVDIAGKALTKESLETSIGPLKIEVPL